MHFHWILPKYCSATDQTPNKQTSPSLEIVWEAQGTCSNPVEKTKRNKKETWKGLNLEPKVFTVQMQGGLMVLTSGKLPAACKKVRKDRSAMSEQWKHRCAAFHRGPSLLGWTAGCSEERKTISYEKWFKKRDCSVCKGRKSEGFLIILKAIV